LDREASGFVRKRREGKVVWERADFHSAATLGGLRRSKVTREEKIGDEDEADVPRLNYPFYVRGVEYERSVVTGRLASQVLRDEGVVGYVGRKGWQAILK
jgi:hypothetical protein